MRHRILRSRWVGAVSLGVAALTMSATIGTGTAFAGAPTPPTLGVSPHWFTGNLNGIRDAGSDTTFFLMQALSDLYEQSGLYGCNLASGGSFTYAGCASGASATSGTTDVVDNYDHVEVTTGLGKIGSGDGQKQLCGVETEPFAIPDFARSSKPPSSSNGCSDMIGLAYGKDAVPSVDFPGAEGPGTATSAGSPWAGQIVGPLAAGWLPAGNCVNGSNTTPGSCNGTADPVTCDQSSGPSVNPANTANGCSGIPFTNLDGGPSAVGSVAYDIYNTSATNHITDWMQLTDTTNTADVGSAPKVSGKSFPILLPNVNTGSGTEFTFGLFVDGTGGSTDANSANGGGICGNVSSGILENNSAQFGGCAASDYPATDPEQAADQAAEIASLLYYMSFGAYQSDIHDRLVTLSNGTQYAANVMTQSIGGVVEVASTCTETFASCTIWNGTFPTARLLYNVYRTSTLRASTAGFLDWICNGLTADYGTDQNTGLNYNAEITGDIQTKFEFDRIPSTDTSGSNAGDCPLITVPNAATDALVTNGSANVTSASSGFGSTAGSTPVQVGDLVTGTGVPANTYVASTPAPAPGAITLTNPVTVGGGGSTTETLNFNIHSPTT